MRTSIKLQFTLLVLLIFSAFSVSLGLYFHYQNIQMSQLSKNELAEKQELVKKLMVLQNKHFSDWCNDYTYWDEMVTFANNFDPEWAKINIDTSFHKFGGTEVWVFDKNSKLVYSTDTSVTDPQSEAKILKNFFKARDPKSFFSQSSQVHFFVNTPSGCVEVWGATIHPSLDPERKTPMQGALFAVKLLDDISFTSLASLSKTYLSLSYGDPEPLPARVTGTLLRFSIPLYGPGGELSPPEAYLDVTSESFALRDFYSFSKHFLFFFCVFFSVSFFFCSFVLYFWIHLPIKSISKALDTGDSSSLKKYHVHPGNSRLSPI